VDPHQVVLNAPGELLPANLIPHPTDELVPETITVLLVEDLNLLRGALASLLSGERDIHVVDALTSTDPVVPVTQRLRPNVVVVDVDPADSGLTVVSELRRRLPACQIVALTSVKPARLVRCLLAADVLGVVDKNAPADLLLKAIRGAARGELVVDVNVIITALAEQPNPLTPRQLEVLRLAADGAAGSEIARRLRLSPGTVRNHLAKAISKAGARTTVDAVRIAREAGWL
jgi:two-component system response regulator DesR